VSPLPRFAVLPQQVGEDGASATSLKNRGRYKPQILPQLVGEVPRRGDGGLQPYPQFIFLKPLDIVPIMFHMTSRWFWKEGSELLTYQICQNHVQRLRMFVEVADIPGSRGLDPGAIMTPAHWRPSNPRQITSVRLCKSEPWMAAVLKRYGNTGHLQISAQIAAFQGWAPSRTHSFFQTTACWLEARTGTSPRFYPRFYFHGPPWRFLSHTPSSFGYSPALPREGEKSHAFSLGAQRRGSTAQPGGGVSSHSPQPFPPQACFNMLAC
jgi:hypothetical protein